MVDEDDRLVVVTISQPRSVVLENKHLELMSELVKFSKGSSHVL